MPDRAYPGFIERDRKLMLTISDNEIVIMEETRKVRGHNSMCTLLQSHDLPRVQDKLMPTLVTGKDTFGVSHYQILDIVSHGEVTNIPIEITALDD
jgi:hypothetical protein